MDIPKQYEPHAAFDRWYDEWERKGYFDADPDPAKPPHAIMIPLPNVTGALHMGHALNGTLQDLLTRWKRMQGYEALWMPGTDHAGIATQAVVERRMLEEEGLTRHDIGREALVKRIWTWKDAYEKRILGQLRRLGASCDWRRTRFTLDEVCSKAVRRTFFKMFQDGLIYRGKRLVNWDTFLQTAVADDEVFEEETDGKFWTFRYPVVGDDGNLTDETIAFSTTRPETMLGDTAVCVHPSDERYKHLVGRKVRIPLNGRDIPIIADALLAEMEKGTGAVKVTPAHDPNDYACGQRNNLPHINLLNPDGTLNDEAGKYKGIDRLDARPQVVEEMERLGYFVSVEDRKIPLKHSDRSKTPVEPYLSDQWFVKMEDLAQNAIDAVDDGRVRFYPSRYARTYVEWLAEKRDWCISRQLWWGHRIPIWRRVVSASATDDDWDAMFHWSDIDEMFGPAEDEDEYAVRITDLDTGNEIDVEPGDIGNIDAYRGRNLEVLLCKKREKWNREAEALLEELGFEQDPDVLDTWFSSALWPHETLGWPDGPAPMAGEIASEASPLNSQPSTLNPLLDYFYPTSVLVTSRDIITLWVARMVLTGLYNMGEVPFAHVCIHPKILDGFGKTMSKSKGNGVDPMDLIDKYGTDAVRFTIASFAGETQDIRLPVGYEDPETGEIVPQEERHTTAKPKAGVKPRIKFPKSGKSLQYSTPNYEPDPGEPVARMVSERFEYGRNFCNKLWNAARFALLNLEGYTPGVVNESELTLEDRWILSRLSTVCDEVTTLLGRYQFDQATRSIRDFTWNEFCDWYLEMIKPRLRIPSEPRPSGSDSDDAAGQTLPDGRGSDERAVAQRVLVGVLDSIVRLLHPFAPFITEELYQRLNEVALERGLLAPTQAAEACIVAPWPELPAAWRDADLEAKFNRLQETIIAVRNVRAVYNISPAVPLKLALRCTADLVGPMQDVAGQFENLAKTMLASVGAEVERPTGSASFALDGLEGYVPLGDVIDLDAERQRQKKEADRLHGQIAGSEKKLSNESFVAKAPPEVVAGAREQLESLKKQLTSVEQILAELGG
ncbi:MAG: valine--tRNA ligase [Planctomycetaceae bacterium]